MDRAFLWALIAAGVILVIRFIAGALAGEGTRPLTKLSRTQATIINDLVLLLVDEGMYRNLEEARQDFNSWDWNANMPDGSQLDLLERKGRRAVSIKDLSESEANHLISLYQSMLQMGRNRAAAAGG